MVAEFAGYENVLPGAADRILSMAEQSLNIEEAERKAAAQMETDARKAENISVIIASVAFSFLPWVGFGSAVACAAFGNNTGTVLGSVIGAISAGPQLIDALKRKRK